MLIQKLKFRFWIFCIQLSVENYPMSQNSTLIILILLVMLGNHSGKILYIKIILMPSLGTPTVCYCWRPLIYISYDLINCSPNNLFMNILNSSFKQLLKKHFIHMRTNKISYTQIWYLNYIIAIKINKSIE